MLVRLHAIQHESSSICERQGYFRISLKRGQTHRGKFQEGAKPNPKGGSNPMLKIGKANCQGGGAKAPPHPPEINSER